MLTLVNALTTKTLKSLSVVRTQSLRYFSLLILSCLFLNGASAATEQSISDIVKDANKTLPIQLDKDLELTSIGLDENNKVITYNLRFLNLDGNQISKSTLDQVLSSTLPKKACSDKNTRSFINKDYAIEYKYHDKAKQLVSNLKVTKAECEAQKQ